MTGVRTSDEGHLDDAARWGLKCWLFEQALSQLDRELAAAGIEFVPFKGAHLLVTRPVDRLPPRRMDDIDILVRPCDYERTIDFLIRRGTAVLAGTKLREFEVELHYYGIGTRVLLDIHRAPTYAERVLLDVEGVWQRSAAQGAAMRIASPEDALLLRLIDLHSHLSTDKLLDVSMLTAVEGFSWEAFWAVAQEAGAKRFCRFGLALHETIHGTKLPGLSRRGYFRVAARLALLLGLDRAPRLVYRTAIDLPLSRNPGRLLWRWLIHGRNRGRMPAVQRQPVSGQRGQLGQFAERLKEQCR